MPQVLPRSVNAELCPSVAKLNKFVQHLLVEHDNVHLAWLNGM